MTSDQNLYPEDKSGAQDGLSTPAPDGRRLHNRLRRIELEAAERGEPCTVHISRYGQVESYSGADWFEAAARAAIADVRHDFPELDAAALVDQCCTHCAWLGPYGPRQIMHPVGRLSPRARRRYREVVMRAASEPPRRPNAALLRALEGRRRTDGDELVALADASLAIGPDPFLPEGS